MVEAVARDEMQRWLEPSCGKGVFIEALNDIGVPRKKIIGVDLDVQTADADTLANVTRGRDFLKWSSTRGGRFDCVVGNPPYVSIKRLPESLKGPASGTIDFNGKRVGDGANTWYPFMVQAVRLLRKGGNLAFILPAACEYADYASAGRATLTSLFDRVDVIRSRQPLFDVVSEGVVVLIAQNKGGGGKLHRRHEAKNLSGVIRQIRKLSTLKARCCPSGTQRRGNGERIRLGDIMKIRIGGVTGDADYFLFSDKERKGCSLPKSAFVPVVSRSKHLMRGVHNDASWHVLRDMGEKVWLFRPAKRLLSHKAVSAYLKLSQENGGCHRSRFKIEARDPWYQTPLPKTPDVFLTGMSGLGLWMCMNEYSLLNATNTLYVGMFREDYTRSQKFAWALTLLTSGVQKQIARSKRVYADGLSKFEPGQISQLEIPVPPSIRDSVSMYRKASRLLFEEKKQLAIQVADSVIS